MCSFFPKNWTWVTPAVELENNSYNLISVNPITANQYIMHVIPVGGVIFSSHQPNFPWWLMVSSTILNAWLRVGYSSLHSPILVILDDYFDNIELPPLLEMPSKIRRRKMKVWTYSVRMLRIITGVAAVEWTLYTLWTRSLFLRFGACFMEL